MMETEHTHRRGKDYSTAGLQFNWIGYEPNKKMCRLFCMSWNYWIQTSQTGDQPYSDPSPYGEGSL